MAHKGRSWLGAMFKGGKGVATMLGILFGLGILLGRGLRLVGIEIRGRAELLPAEHEAMRAAISLWHEKYRPLLAGEGFGRFAGEVRELGFLRVVPEVLVGWDHARGR